ncbi:MAG: sugar phosphate nucleotidyltransferase [Eisenbergiella sp.]
MAGGKGTRLSSITGDKIPKPMVTIDEKPILEYQIKCLRKWITEIIIIVGHLHETIQQYFGKGEKWECQFDT